jgi:hypothetical protein
LSLSLVQAWFKVDHLEAPGLWGFDWEVRGGKAACQEQVHSGRLPGERGEGSGGGARRRGKMMGWGCRGGGGGLAHDQHQNGLVSMTSRAHGWGFLVGGAVVVGVEPSCLIGLWEGITYQVACW